MSSNNGKGSTATIEAEATEGTVRLVRLERQVFEIPIRGTAPLIVHRWDEKAKKAMLDASQKKAKTKTAKDPVAEFEAAKYLLPDGRHGFPAVAFKAAIVFAARLFDKSVTQVSLRQMVTVVGEGPQQLVPIAFGKCSMREDAVRVGQGSADLRYRPQYDDWSALLRIRTISGQFDIESLFALADAAGIGGVGEWRPTAPKSATGSYGTFEVVES